MIYKIFNNVFFTKGFNRTSIYDSLNSNIHFLPNNEYDALAKNNFLIDSIEKNELFDFLFERNLLFEYEDALQSNFPEMNRDIDIPYKIIGCIIFLTDRTSNDLQILNSSINNGSIPQFNFIFTKDTTLESLEKLNDFLCQNEADTIEITFFDDFIYFEQFLLLIKENRKIFIFNNYSEKTIEDPSTHKNRFDNDLGIKNLKISTDLLTYFESSGFNVYYNRKIFIDKDSNIKKALNSDKTYGVLCDFDTAPLVDVINHSDFQEFWKIKKDDTLVCMDCEFKRICVDNRIPENSDSNLWYYNTECDYNPFISKWNDEDGYLSLEESGVSFENNAILANENLLGEINDRLWNVD